MPQMNNELTGLPIWKVKSEEKDDRVSEDNIFISVVDRNCASLLVAWRKLNNCLHEISKATRSYIMLTVGKLN